MFYFFFILISFIPGVLWLLYFLEKDNLHPEPKLLIIETFLLGIFISAPILIAEQAYISIFDPATLSMTLLGAALIEEYFKYFVLKIHILKSEEFDEPIDAMVYCITAGLGFATIENILWVVKTSAQNGRKAIDPFIVLGVRAIGATVLHALASGIIGFALAFSFFVAKDKKTKSYYLFFGIIIATIVHFLYNFLLMENSIDAGKIRLIGSLLIMTAIAISMGFNAVKKIKVA